MDRERREIRVDRVGGREEGGGQAEREYRKRDGMMVKKEEIGEEE